MFEKGLILIVSVENKHSEATLVRKTIHIV